MSRATYHLPGSLLATITPEIQSLLVDASKPIILPRQPVGIYFDITIHAFATRAQWYTFIKTNKSMENSSFNMFKGHPSRQQTDEQCSTTVSVCQ